MILSEEDIHGDAAAFDLNKVESWNIGCDQSGLPDHLLFKLKLFFFPFPVSIPTRKHPFQHLWTLPAVQTQGVHSKFSARKHMQSVWQGR